MKTEQSLLKKVLILNFCNSIENQYSIKEYSNFKQKLNSKLLELRGLISLYYESKFLHLIFNEIEEIFDYKYDKKIDLVDNLLIIIRHIEKVDNIIQNHSLLENLVKIIMKEFDIQYEYTTNSDINSHIHEINDSNFLDSPCWTGQTQLNFSKIG